MSGAIQVRLQTRHSRGGDGDLEQEVTEGAEVWGARTRTFERVWFSLCL